MTTSLLQRGYDLLNRAAGDVAAETVQYIRGVEVVDGAMAALLSRREIAIADTGEASIYAREFSWQLKRSQLLLHNVPIMPTRGDRIVWEHDSNIYTFEVLPDASQPESGAIDPRSDWVPATAKLVAA